MGAGRSDLRQLLVICDDEGVCVTLRRFLGPEPLDVTCAHTAAAGLEAFATSRPAIVVLDLHLPGTDGLDILPRLRSEQDAVAVIVLTGDHEIRNAVRAMQMGAFDYLTKPIHRDEFVISVRRAQERNALLAEVELLRSSVTDKVGLLASMGSSPQVTHVIEQVRVVADSPLTVLIQGETGTGKELVAQALHRESARRKRPLIAVDCGAVPGALLESELFGHEKGAFTGAEQRRSGYFRLAEGGTLFLDEVANLPLALQPKLLRALESREVRSLGGPSRATPIDVRFVVATNHELGACVRAGTFREDLYFRLEQFTIHLPTLRDRKSDIPYLARRFQQEACIELRRPVCEIAPEALLLLQQHDWPGNVRELRNVVRQAVLTSTSPIIDKALVAGLLSRRGESHATRSMPPTGATGRPLKEIADAAMEDAERAAICDALRVAHGNQSHAARALHVDYKTLRLRLKRYGIRAQEFGEN